MAQSSTMAKRKYNDKTYKRWLADLRCEDFEMIEKARGKMSRAEFLKMLVNEHIKNNTDVDNIKEKLLKEFESCLDDFWGEEPTKTAIKEAWIDYLDSVKSGGEDIPKEYYKLTKEEREHLYKVASV